jgi:hypothetical protein
MKNTILFIALIGLFSCQQKPENQASLQEKLIGTWELVSAIQIKKDTTISTRNDAVQMIKIINSTHFSFLKHALNPKKDSTIAHQFGAGGGKYVLKGNNYTETLEYFSYKEYEGHDFSFQIEIKGDTLIQRGEEKYKDLGIGNENVKIIETYVRMK